MWERTRRSAAENGEGEGERERKRKKKEGVFFFLLHFPFLQKQKETQDRLLRPFFSIVVASFSFAVSPIVAMVSPHRLRMQLHLIDFSRSPHARSKEKTAEAERQRGERRRVAVSFFRKSPLRSNHIDFFFKNNNKTGCLQEDSKRQVEQVLRQHPQAWSCAEHGAGEDDRGVF